jgi:hypothetical protein
MAELTRLLVAACHGDKKSAEQAFSLRYDNMRQSQHFTLLDPTSLVHESYLKFIGIENLQVEDRRHFFADAATDYLGIIIFESFSSTVVNEDLSNDMAIWRNLWADGIDWHAAARNPMAPDLHHS